VYCRLGGTREQCLPVLRPVVLQFPLVLVLLAVYVPVIYVVQQLQVEGQVCSAVPSTRL
jgi:hypothetical protein